ncbi:MAG: Arginine--tRNA ligase, partial [Candidatus Parcubacteria bacterium]
MKDRIIALLRQALPHEAVLDVEIPPRVELGHYSTSVAMRLAKTEKRPPMEVAKELAKKIEEIAPKGLCSKVEAAPPGFVNFWFSDETVKEEFARLAKEGIVFPNAAANRKQTVIVEYASLNIAKPFHVGYLRNIAIGDAFAKIYAALGYHVIRWNYLGDWGTQFGKLIAAYKLWGKKEDIEREPIQAMLDLYVRFHDE